jgi:anti-sigma factor RsiW
MSCEDIERSLVDYYYRDLPAEERRSIALHLGSCARCALEYCRLEADLSGLRDLLESDEPGPGVKSTLAAKVEAEFGAGLWTRLQRIVSRPLPAYQAALFASAVAALLFLFVAQKEPEPASSSSSPYTVPRAASRTASRTVIDQVDASTVVAVDPDLL